MKIKIGENIRRLRKENSMMQENLAEALGVSVGAVSKWERGAAAPDLNYIVEMASLFAVSVDVLLGYEMQNSSADAVFERLRKLRQLKDYKTGLQELATAQQKYPNNFRIIHYCATFYQLMGLESSDKTMLSKSIELFDHSLLLLPQNTDPEINAITINNDIATCYLCMGQKEQAIELLKKNNICGINNSVIGMNCSSEPHRSDEALKYLSRSFGNCLQDLLRTMLGFANLHYAKGNYEESLSALLWLIEYMDSIRREDRTVTYMDKVKAPFYGQCAVLAGKLGRLEEARAYLEKACFYARRFDAAPNYGVTNLKFCTGIEKEAVAYDDLGVTALAAVEEGLYHDDASPAIQKYWEEIKNGQKQ